MPIKKEYYHDIDLNANQLFNSRLHNVTTAARILLGGSLTINDKGYQVYDIDLNSPYYWDGSAWTTVTGVAAWGSITGTLTSQTDLITYLTTNYYPLSSNPANYITSAALAPYLTSAIAASTYVPLNRNITINGVTQNLSADRTWSVGDVLTSGSYSNPSWLTSLAWSKITGAPTIPTVTPSALTKVDDTNVTLTLGGNPSTALLAATSLTLGWTGTLADSRIASAATWNAKVGGSGTATRVAFWDTSSSLSSSSNLYWDNINNRLGVGTSTPSNTFDATANFGVDTPLDNYQGFVARIQNTKDYNDVNGVLLLVNQNGGSGGYLIRGLNAQAGEKRFEVDGAGNLYTKGYGNITEWLSVKRIYWKTDIDGWIGDNGQDDTFVINTNNTERVRVVGGNVGIGTSSPSKKLDVIGTGRFDDRLSLTNSTNGGQLDVYYPNNTDKFYIGYAPSQPQLVGGSLIFGKTSSVFGIDNSIFAAFHPITSNNIFQVNTTAANITAPNTTGVIVSTTGYNTFTPASGSNYLYGIHCPLSINPSGGTNEITHNFVRPLIDCTGGTTKIRGFHYSPSIVGGNVGVTSIAFENDSGDIIHGNLATGGADEMVTVDSVGKLKRQAIPGGGGGGVTRSVNTVSGNTSAGAAANTDYYYFVSALATITLPTAVGNTNEYTIKRTGSGVVTIDTTSSQTIDGSLTIALNVVNQSVTLISDGANWQII